jgi:hypothetical protein
MPYEVLYCTFCGDYRSAFYYPDTDGVLVPEIFATRSEAGAALAEFLSDRDQERRSDQAERYERCDYRIGYIYGQTTNTTGEAP